MLIVLPPSETKAWGGDGASLDVDKLSFPTLNKTRLAIAKDLAGLSVKTAQKVLGLSDKQLAEAESNRELLSSPTMPAIFRYTGVLFDALDAPTLPTSALKKLAIGSALFGVVRAQDPIPHYRLSGGTKLPHRGAKTPTMKARWGSAITEALDAEDGLLIDLRSGTYQQLGCVPRAITVRVESVQPDGSRKVVSHFNKHYKGLLARELALVDGALNSIDELADAARAAGMVVEINSERELTLVV